MILNFQVVVEGWEIAKLGGRKLGKDPVLKI
jgi:hypothetical protein